MYLKSLELHGFKSFPNRTLLTFERGSTVIVGPNGSGKSNISDAMRWVLGELSSRNIRGTKMEDVISGGTDSRNPMGFAEVSVTFDNTDKSHRIDSPYDEIKVTRRYYPSGDSEYLINGQKKRLRDITDLFMNTGIGREGYSIVGQGRVAELLSRKSEDRRNVFEEAAGIAKFRHRKEETERKRAQTHDNMERIIDIYDELAARLGPLTKDAEKAKKYRDLLEKKKEADVSLWLYDTQKNRNDLQKARDTFELSRKELETIDESIRSLQAQDQRLLEAMDGGRLASEQLLTRINEYRERMYACETELSRLDTDIQHKNELIGSAEKRIAEIEQAARKLSGEDGTYDADLKKIKAERDSLMEERLGVLADGQKVALAASKLSKELEDSLERLNRLQNDATDLKVNMDVLTRSREQDSTRGQSIEAAIRDGEAQEKELTDEVSRCEKNASGFTGRIAELEATAASCDEKAEACRLEKEKIGEEAAALRAERAALEEAAEALRKLEEHFEGYSHAVKAVMEAYDANRLSGASTVYGPLSQLISVRPEHLLAIESTMGADLQNIVVEDEETAKAAICYLKETKSGRTTFYPLTTIRPGPETEEVRSLASCRGYVDRADRLVACEEKFDDIVVWLLSRTVVFDTLDNAVEAAKRVRYRVKLVTLDGQLINPGGSLTGGSLRSGKGSGMLSRGADIEAKMDAAEALTKKIMALNGTLSEKENEIHDLEIAKKDALQQTELLRTMSRAQLSALDNAKARLLAGQEQLEKLREEFSTVAGKDKEIEDEIERLKKQLARKNAEIAALREERAAKDIERNQLLDENDSAQKEASQMSNRIFELNKEIEIAEKMKESLSERLFELNSEKDGQKALVKEYKTTIGTAEEKKKESKEEILTIEKGLNELSEKRQEAEGNISAYNARLGEIREQLRQKQDQKDKCANNHFHAENRLHRLEDDQERLGLRIWEEYELSYEDAVSLNYPPVTSENRSEIASIQTSCRNTMKALGQVNLGAIEEYAEVKARYDEMTVQVEDMKESYDKMTEIILSMEEDMKTQFSAAFYEINRNFGIVFSDLFGGGQAELVLTDPEDVLNCGIDIKAAPPGKIIKSLSLLSGGEQAFVAIALFFAILKVNPTPFCIFDEIEAALDAVNVFRFGEYIKKMSEETQFILITHRPGTMEIAERLYGVTMQERGVSRVLPMDPEQMEQMKETLKKDGVL